MIIYEKWVVDESTGKKVRHLFGNKNSLPTAEDNQLKYVDADGDALEVSFADTYVNKNDSSGIYRMSDKKTVNVGIVTGTGASAETTWVIGKPTEKVLKSIKISKQPTVTEYFVGDQIDLAGAEIVATFVSGETETITTGLVANPDTMPSGEAGSKVNIAIEYTFGDVTKSATFKATVKKAEEVEE